MPSDDLHSMTGQDALSPADVAFLVETRGVAKTTAPVVTTFVLGVVAGAFIALGRSSRSRSGRGPSWVSDRHVGWPVSASRSA
jgi:hypothetical protein